MVRVPWLVSFRSLHALDSFAHMLYLCKRCVQGAPPRPAPSCEQKRTVQHYHYAGVVVVGVVVATSSIGVTRVIVACIMRGRDWMRSVCQSSLPYGCRRRRRCPRCVRACVCVSPNPIGSDFAVRAHDLHITHTHTHYHTYTRAYEHFTMRTRLTYKSRT